MTKTVLISFLLVVCSVLPTIPSRAQNVAVLMQQAQTLEKAFKDDEALKKYIEVLKHDPLHIDALCKTSELYNIIGKRRPTKEEQKQYC